MPSTITQTAFRFRPDDLDLLDAIQAHVGAWSRTEALRVVLRAYARHEKIVIKPAKAKGRK
jgi:hypothetical protein